MAKKRDQPAPGTLDAKRARLWSRPSSQIGQLAMIQPQKARKPRTSGGASMSPVDPSMLTQVKDGVRRPNIGDRWQADAYTYADEIGEVGFIVNLTAVLASRCALDVQEWTTPEPSEQDPEPEGRWSGSRDRRAGRVMNAWVGPQGGQSELKRKGVLHLCIGGDSTLVGLPTDELGVSTGIWWEFLSSEELRLQNQTTPVRVADGVTATPIPADAYLARMWKSHARYSGLADSPLRRVLSICEEVLTYTQLTMAISQSRLAAGIFYLPEEIELVGGGQDTEAEDEPDEDVAMQAGLTKFLKDLIEHMSAPRTDPSSTASLVPLVVRGPAYIGDRPAKDAMGLVEIARELDNWAQGLRKEALQRLAAGLDTDPALIEGKGGMNHWGSYNVDIDLVTKHVVPLGELLADFVTHSYLRPMLETFEDMAPDESRKFRVVFNPAAVMARTDEAASSRVLHEMSPSIISDDATRDANGFDDADKPDEDEVLRRMAWQLVRIAPIQLGPVFAEVLGLNEANGIDWSKITQGMGANQANTGAPGIAQAEQRDASSAQQEPARPAFALLCERLGTAADSAMTRALERAGTRLVNKAKPHHAVRDRISSLPTTRALTVLAPSDLQTINAPAEFLLAGAWDDLSRTSRVWVCDHLEASGVAHLVADDKAALAASQLCSALQDYVTQHLHRTPARLANGLQIPDSLVTRALLAAGVV